MNLHTKRNNVIDLMSSLIFMLSIIWTDQELRDINKYILMLIAKQPNCKTDLGKKR